MTPSLRLCGTLLEVDAATLPRLLSDSQVDLLEWRLDAFLADHAPEQAAQLIPLIAAAGDRLPLLVTNRPEREGGFFRGPEQTRLELLEQAAHHGAEWIDLEEDVPALWMEKMRSRGARVLVSHHDHRETPDRAALRTKLEAMAAFGADAVKLVTLAREAEDNLRVLELISWGRRELSVEVIAFCMGPLGRWSRLVSALFGSLWSYVQLPQQPTAAPGQLTAEEARTLWTHVAP